MPSKVESKTKTYAYQYWCAFNLLEIGSQNIKSQKYCAMSIIVMSAFMLESYLNHLEDGISDLGKFMKSQRDEELIRSKKKKAGWEVNLESVCNFYGIELSKRSRHIFLARSAFKFRNKMAHGRTDDNECLLEQKISDPKTLFEKSDNDWQRLSNIDDAKKIFDGISDIIRDIQHFAHTPDDNPKDPFSSMRRVSAQIEIGK